MNKNNKSGDYEYKEVFTSENITKKNKTPYKYGYGVRHIQLIIFFLCLAINVIMRAHLAVTVVAMTNTSEKTIIVNTTELDKRKDENNGIINISGNESKDDLSRNGTMIDTLVQNSFQTYDWPKSTQEMVLGSFFLGYCIMMFPFGLICQRWGGKLPLQIGLFVNGIASILTPWLGIWGGWKAVCACRILQGLSQAGTYPSLQSLMAKWVAVSERATMASLVYIGTTAGTVVGFQLAGFLSTSRWGWPSTFWVVGALSLIMFAVLTAFGAATPLDHRTISEEEKNYILGVQRSIRKPKTPWKAILTSKPAWATFIAQIGSGSSFVFLFNQVPSYIHYILGVNIKNSGLLSSLPYIASFITSIGFGWVSDYCTNNNIVSVKSARIISNTIAHVGLALALIAASYTDSITVAVSCLVISVASHMGVHSGWMVNHIDMAPNFSGTLMAVASTLTTTVVVLLPILVANVVTDMTNITQWRTMFYIIAGGCVFTNAVFVTFMSADTQPWNDIDQSETCIEEQKMEDKIEKEKK